MTWVLVTGVIISAGIAYFFGLRLRTIKVKSLITSTGMTEDQLSAIKAQPGESVLTIILEDGRSINTTAAALKDRLLEIPPEERQTGDQNEVLLYIERLPSNMLALVLFVIGCAISIALFFLSA